MQDLQLDSINQGAKVCIIRKDGSFGSIYIIGEYSDTHGKYRLIRPTSGKHCGLLPTDGVGYAFMSASKSPDFYYSANPEHIKQAEEAIYKARQQELYKQQQTQAKLQELKGKINALLSEYNASLDAVQTEGDSHGVEFELSLSIGNQAIEI